MDNDFKRCLESIIFELNEWARWQKGYRLKLGYPSKAIGLESGYVSHTFEDLCDEADNSRLRIVDCAVNDLESPTQKAAIHHRYLGTVVRFPRNNLPELLLEAHLEIMKNLRKRGIDV